MGCVCVPGISVFSDVQCLLTMNFGVRAMIRDFLNLLTVHVLVCVITYTHGFQEQWCYTSSELVGWSIKNIPELENRTWIYLELFFSKTEWYPIFLFKPFSVLNETHWQNSYGFPQEWFTELKYADGKLKLSVQCKLDKYLGLFKLQASGSGAVYVLCLHTA